MEPLVCLYEERVKQITEERDAEIETLLNENCGFDRTVK